MIETKPQELAFEELDSVIIRFSGDSGDGMQLTGTQFTNTSAVLGNDISTFPDFPAEIRAPAGTLAGVSGFQVNLANSDVFTPGDAPNVLVAMNPAALAANLADLEPGGILILNTDAFQAKNLKKAHFEGNPLEDGTLSKYNVISVPISTLNKAALADLTELSNKEVERTKNFFALGLTYFMYDRPLDTTLQWISHKFKNPVIAEANTRALKAGWNYGDTTEAFQHRYRIRPAQLPPGTYRKVTGNEALSLGLVTAARLAGKPLFLIGAAFGGAMAATASSGPGLELKMEAINLALVLELPMVIIDVQRGGPSTGLPTKTEQSDLLMAYFGRNGESPIPILAPCTPSDCFTMALEAFRLAVRSMTPVFVLSDGYLGNSSEPWKIPEASSLPRIVVKHPTEREGFQPYRREEETLARPWAIPGTPGLEHRIGGLGKAPLTGNVSYKPEDHLKMVTDRAEKVARLADAIEDQPVFGPSSGDLLVVGWGSTFGAIRTAVQQAQAAGLSVASTHIRYLNPFPHNLEGVLRSYKKILVPEMNMGQLAFLLRGRFGLDIISYPKVLGRPFTIGEIRTRIHEILAQGRKP
ncbi:2-oxoglutarate ferredoxin oxidoreductase subunit alpha [bacterium CPR1]|nr:2-oxoglutarate ferredoxin oxidoreductase subunit alpha [bacterium CPR1]